MLGFFTRSARDYGAQWGDVQLHEACVIIATFLPMRRYKNRIEHVWKDAKGAIANIQRDTFDETKTAFVGHMNDKKFQYRI
jgi:hypothetical protein